MENDSAVFTFIWVVVLTCVTGLLSFLIFALCSQQSPNSGSYKIDDAFNELNALRRKLTVIWKKNRKVAWGMGILTLCLYYIRLKRRNAIGVVDTTLVSGLIMLLIAMTTKGIYDILYAIVTYYISNH